MFMASDLPCGHGFLSHYTCQIVQKWTQNFVNRFSIAQDASFLYQTSGVPATRNLISLLDGLSFVRQITLFIVNAQIPKGIT